MAAPLTDSERACLAQGLRAREQILRGEIRRGLVQLGSEGYSEQLSGTSDPGDESMAMMLSDLANAEVARDVAELRDILAAERRLAAGTYGTCIDCGIAIPYARLAAYPTAKRCLRCQEIREATHS
jgi:RNA polymerase-binding transcription factor DksA